MPWTARVWSQPGLLVLGTGRVAPLVDLPHPRPSDLLFAWPGGVGVPAWWLTFGLLVAAFSVLVRRDRVLTGLSAWALVAAGLIAGVIASHTVADVDGVRALGWPGAAAAMIGVGLVVATALAADGALPRLEGASFGLRQPLAAAVAVLALTAPLLASGVVAGERRRRPRSGSAGTCSTVLPDFLAGNLGGTTGLRALVLRSDPDRRLVHRDPGQPRPDPRPGRARDLAPHQRASLDQLVQALAGGSGDAAHAARQLCRSATWRRSSPTHAAGPGARHDGRAVPDAVLVRPRGVEGHRPRSAGLVIRPPAGDLSAPRLVPSTPDWRRHRAPAGADGRSLVLANAAATGWKATLDGHAAAPPRVVDGWAQGFALPAAGGQLVLRYDASPARWLALELIALLVVLVLAAPSVRADDGPPVRPSTTATTSSRPTRPTCRTG